jgi:diguanylate cyclase (GGDEF)-like protein/PAS domain S-box-containing protein
MTGADGPSSARWFEQLANGNETLFYVLRIKPDLAVEYATGAIETLTGWTVAEALADAEPVLSAIEATHKDGLDELLSLAPGSEKTIELTWRHRNGSLVYGRTYVRSRQRDDGSVVVDGATRDVTHVHDLETELHHSEERYRLLVEHTWDVVWTTGFDGRITYVSPAVERLRGVSAEETIHETIDTLYPPESAASIRNYFRTVLDAIEHGTKPPAFRLEHEFYRRDGSTVPAEMQVIPHLDEDGQVVELIGVTRDITERRELETELKRLAVTDPLTGVWNRRHGEELLSADLGQAHRDGRSLSLLILDVDHFKAINDTRGHQAGDRVLVEVGQRLMAACRETDMVARWGGEEFVVLLRDCSLEDGLNTADAIRAAIADAPFLDGRRVTVSIGVAAAGPDDDFASWVARADAALYAAKRSGRNNVRAS